MKALLFFLFIICLQGCGIKVDVGSSAIVSDAVPAPSLLTLVTPTSNVSFVDTPMVTVSGVTIGDTITVFSDNCSTVIGMAVAAATTVNITTSALPEGIYNLKANATRAGLVSRCSTSSINYTLDTTAPTISVTAPTPRSYTVSENLNFTVTVSEVVTVSTTVGTPRIALDIGGTTRYANYFSGSGSRTLTFRYTIQALDNDSNGIVITSPLVLNHGSIEDLAGNASTPIFSIPNTASILVDNTAPTILSVTAPLDGIYAENLDFYVNTSEDVTVVTTGGIPPRIALDIGGSTRYADYYPAGSTPRSLSFRYTIQALEMDLDGIVVSQPPGLVPNSGTIRDAVALNLDLAFAAPVTNAVLVDSTVTPPTVTGIIPPVNRTYLTSTGEDLVFTVNFSENVTVTGVPALTLELDGINRRAIYISGTTTNELLFKYITVPSDSDTNGIALNSNWDFTLGSIRNGATVSVSTSIPAPSIPNLSGVLIDQSPYILSIDIDDDTYIYNQNLDFEVEFSEIVTGTTTKLAFDVGATTVNADYLSGSGTTTLVYRWTNVGLFTDNDGITLSSPIIDGPLKDSVTNDAVLSFTVPDLSAVLVDGALPPTGFNYYGATNFTLMPGASTSATLYPSFTGGDAATAYTVDLFLHNLTLGAITGEITFDLARKQDSNPQIRVFTASNSGGFDTESLAITLLPMVEKDKIGVGDAHTCAIANGGVFCWGDLTYGIIGGPARAYPIGYNGGALQVIAAGSGVRLISAAAGNTCIVNAYTNIVCWGRSYAATPFLLAATRSSDNEYVDHVSHISVGPNHSCYLRFGKAYCWGSNSNGELGNGQTGVETLTPQLVLGGHQFEKIVVGGMHTCALSGKNMYCWGFNRNSQLGDGSIPEYSNIPVFAREAHDIAVGDFFSCALYQSQVFCWGENSYNRLGRDTSAVQIPPLNKRTDIASISEVSKISIHPMGDFVLTIKRGKGWGWGRINKFTSAASTGVQPVLNIGSYISDIVAGRNNAFYLKADPNLNVEAGWFGVGFNSNGELGTGSSDHHQENLVLNLNSNASFTGLRAGAESTCVHLSSTPHCFGSNDSDQLTARVQDIFLPLNNVFDSLYIADIDLNEMVMTDSVHGVDHSCYSSGTSTLCAGRDGGGLGVLSDGGIAQPYDGSVLVPLIGANKKMCAGDYFTCRLDIFGDVSCWGDNSNLQIAAGIIPSYSSPQPVITSQDVTDIACLANSLCFIKDDQKVYCQGEIVAQGTPLQLLDLVADKFVKIKAGAQFFCAQTNNGKLYCTGDNTNSELGHSAASTDMTTGSLVMSNDNSSHAQRPVLDFGLGSNHGCASSYDSTIRKQRLWCWGSDRFGQVTGVGGGGPTNIFRKIGDAGPGIGEIVGGAKHTCIQYQGGVYCWGKGFALGFDINNNPAYGVLNPILPLVYR